MAPHDIWDLNPIFVPSFYESYVSTVLVEGLGFDDPFPIYGTMIDAEWEEEEEEDDLEADEDIQDILDFISLNAHGRNADDPIDLTKE